MEIQHGKGPWAPPVSGIVPLGSTLTLVVAINDYRGEFDMRVKSCIASDGSGHVIKLSDDFGCVLRPKMISRFLKARAPNEKATVITYAFFHAFKFPDALSVHIKCKVEICRHGCLEHCQLNGNVHERKDTILPTENSKTSDHNSLEEDIADVQDTQEDESNNHDVFYDDIIHHGDDMAEMIGGFGNSMGLTQHLHEKPVKEEHSDFGGLEMEKPVNEPEHLAQTRKDEKFPHGPRQLDAQDRLGMPAVAGPRSLDLDDIHPVYNKDSQPKSKIKKRSIKILDRHVRTTDVGVSGIYDVISEADLEFTPETKQEAVTVFQGKITEEVVYGICMPIPGFSVLFILVTSAAIISALVAGSLLYRYQLQKESLAHQQNSPNRIASWMTMRLFRMRQHSEQVPVQ